VTDGRARPGGIHSHINFSVTIPVKNVGSHSPCTCHLSISLSICDILLLKTYLPALKNLNSALFCIIQAKSLLTNTAFYKKIWGRMVPNRLKNNWLWRTVTSNKSTILQMFKKFLDLEVSLPCLLGFATGLPTRLVSQQKLHTHVCIHKRIYKVSARLLYVPCTSSSSIRSP